MGFVAARGESVARPWWVTGLIGAAVVGVLVILGATAADAAHRSLFSGWIYTAASLLAAALCLARAALVPEQRKAWLLFGIAVGAWILGDIYWIVFLSDSSHYPSPADAFYLAYYPLALAGLIALSDLRLARQAWLDGLIAGLATTAVLFAFLVPAVADDSGDTMALVTNFAYPVGDAVLLASLVTLTVLGALPLGRALALLAAGLLLFIVGDTAFLLQELEGAYEEGGWVDPIWLVGFLLVALAAWAPVARPGAAPGGRARHFALAGGFGLLGLGVLVVDHFDRVPTAGLALATLSLAALILRMTLSLAEVERAVRSAEWNAERYRTLVETSSEAVITIDRGGRYTFVNERFTELSGYSADEVLGETILDLLTEGEPRDELARRLTLGIEYEPITIELEGRTKAGDRLWLLANASPMFDDSGEKTGWLAMLSDITARHLAQQALLESESRFRAVFEDAPVGMAVAAIEDDHLGRYLQVNASYCGLTGYPEKQLLEMRPADLVHPADQGTESAALLSVLAGERDSYQVEKRLLSARGEALMVVVTASLIRDAEGEPRYTIRHVIDIGERKRFEEQLEQLATHDPMTGLINRRRLDEELDRELAAAARHGEPGALMMLDLDGFKQINDSYGHEAGDEALIAISHAVLARLRRTDIFARVGGDEFVVLLPRTSVGDASAIAADLLRTVRATPVAAGEGDERLTASVGIAVFTADEEVPIDDLLTAADRAMYDAKHAGRDRYAVAADQAIAGGRGEG